MKATLEVELEDRPGQLKRLLGVLEEVNANIISIETKMAGPLTLVGKGAVENETASAALADLIEISDKVDGK